MEFKQNKYLPAEKQVVTADPDVTSVSIALHIMLFKEEKTCRFSCLCFICGYTENFISLDNLLLYFLCYLCIV